jgi:hypothetical protein
MINVFVLFAIVSLYHLRFLFYTIDLCKPLYIYWYELIQSYLFRVFRELWSAMSFQITF